MSEMTSMTYNESVERFAEGLKKAASRCREMGAMQRSNTWGIIATQLENLRKKGETVAVTKALSRHEQLIGINNYQKKMN